VLEVTYGNSIDKHLSALEVTGHRIEDPSGCMKAQSPVGKVGLVESRGLTMGRPTRVT